MDLSAALLAAAGPNDFALMGRIAVAALAGMVVGWERDVRNHAAGSRTFGLMTTGAAVFTAAGVATPGQTGRVIAGVATGVGFIGAGLVWRARDNVHGLTTGAAMWAMVAVGVLAGVGHPFLAAVVTAMVLLILEIPFAPVIRAVDPRRISYRFRGENDPPADRKPQPGQSEPPGA